MRPYPGPSPKFPAGLFSICTGSYDIKHAFTEMDAAYTNKPPGGVAYRCSFRVTEAAHAIERIRMCSRSSFRGGWHPTPRRTGSAPYASRSTPTAGAAGAMAARKIRDKAKKIAAHLLEVAEEDLEWEPGKFTVKGAPQKSKTIQEIAFAAYTNHLQGMEAGLDRGTGMVKVRRFVAVDDCGNIINPMIVDGQIHGVLTMGMAPALMEEISYDEEGNNQAGSFMDYLVPIAMETPKWETDKTVTPSPHHPFGAKGVGESATVGAPPAIANAVVDALAYLGVSHIDIPITPEKVWMVLREKEVAE